MTLIEMARQIEDYESKRLCLVSNSAYIMKMIRAEHGAAAGKIVERLNYLSEKDSSDTKRHALWAEVEKELDALQEKNIDVLPGMTPTTPVKLPGM